MVGEKMPKFKIDYKNIWLSTNKTVCSSKKKKEEKIQLLQ